MPLSDELAGSFWLTFGATLVPFYNAVGAYATDPAHPASGLENPQFYNTFGFYIVAMDVICTILCIASIRTNVCFFVMFLMIIPDCKYTDRSFQGAS